jgi:transcription-repair coupling factor (superfamily II helicase)
MLFPAVTENLSRLAQHPAMDDALAALRRGSPLELLAGLTDPVKALTAALAAAELRRPVLILVESDRRAEDMLEPLRFFARALSGPSAQVVLLPALDALPGQDPGPHPEILETRAASLWRFTSGQVSVMVAPAAASVLTFAEAGDYGQLALSLERDQEISLDDALRYLRKAGYTRTDLVEMPGQYALRGGILDVFPPEAPRPVRVELLGDTVESLREFDPESQRSTAPLSRVALSSLTEFAAAESESGPGDNGTSSSRPASPRAGSTLFDLRGDLLVILDESERVQTAAADARERIAASAEEQGAAADSGGPSIIEEQAWQDALASCQQLVLEQLALQREGVEPRSVGTRIAARYRGQVAAFMAEVRGEISAGQHVLIAAASAGELERLADLCREYEVPYALGELEESATGARLVDESAGGGARAAVLLRAPLSEGFLIPDLHLVFHGNSDLFETVPRSERPRARVKTAGFYSDLSELKPGHYVVHVDHGIGQFQGLQTLESDGRRGEFMSLRYADDARLYVPLERMDLIHAYHAVEDAKPQLDRLGGTAWATRKARVRKSVSDMADKLLELYAERKARPGIAFPPDTPWQGEFEEAFEFSETADQEVAIADIKRDMERPEPMDRLLCGDVGYGKTEVAMRAAFKVVCDGKQVAVLAPTTVLAFQHYETFRQRMSAFPVKVDMLSRFRSAAEQKKTLVAVEAGKVDILIGTHRLLSKDVRFHDLGLLVVDEEQRFGVAHKERLKELTRNVDVLTLTATPIPRTLNMSLVGLRDMSVIETPPKDRLAIQTVVAPFTEGLVARAITEELERGGQVFFVHNRVESIYSVANLVKKLVPKARVVVGHGQMNERELEKVMLAFVRDEADVLVSTTIVENGLDIPRANTIIINRADRLGLSELYQLRGRVGRSNRRAYAYLLVPPGGKVTPLAQKRLSALREFSELGAGFRIAALDLELRGAGNLLGREQHGHIGAVGFDLYCQMMERAVAGKKGEAAAPELRTTLNLGLDIRIPPEYISSEALRLRTYKRIADVASEEERSAVQSELTDRFGPPPPSVENLLEYAVLKSACERLQISSVERRGVEVVFRFYPSTPVSPESLVRLVHRQKGARLEPSGLLAVSVDGGKAGVAGTVRNVLLRLEAGD